MTLAKLLDVLEAIKRDPYVSLRGSQMNTTAGGELNISLGCQPDRNLDRWLKHKGFIVPPGSDVGEYIYRPVTHHRKDKDGKRSPEFA